MQTITQHILTDQMDYQNSVVPNITSHRQAKKDGTAGLYCIPRQPKRQITAVTAAFHFFRMNSM